MSKKPNNPYLNVELKRPVDIVFPQAGRVDALADRHCVKPPFGCGKPIGDFKDQLSAKEYTISGLCQDCQDEVFGSE